MQRIKPAPTRSATNDMIEAGLQVAIHFWDAEAEDSYRRQVIADIYLAMRLAERQGRQDKSCLVP